MENPSEIQSVFFRYLDNQYSEDDLRRILEYFQVSENITQLRTLIAQELLRPENKDESLAIDRITAHVDIQLETVIDQKRAFLPLYRRWYFGAAASVLLVLGAIATYSLYRANSNVQQSTVVQQSDAIPGGNKATLTLADGSVISLNEAAKGKLADESGVAISKNSDGQLRYDDTGAADNGTLGYNEVSTPNGGQYGILLPDGTMVWLNAASTLRYPTRFTSAQRKVTLHGEAYFEVAPKKHQPFIVESKGQEVEVLGTHFNINSYTNEKVVKTTLLEGSIKVTEPAKHLSKILKPGQASLIKDQSILITSVDTDAVIAWKDGLFRFDNTDIKTLMRQLERWYDIEVDENALPDRKFNGEMSRDVKLSQVLNMIAVTSNLQFKLEGRRLIMVP